MNELYLRLAMDEADRQMDRALGGANRYESYDEMDSRQHISRMQRLLNWKGTILDSGLKPGSTQAEPRKTTAS